MWVFSLSCVQWPHKSTMNFSNKFCRSFILKTGSHNCQNQSCSHHQGRVYLFKKWQDISPPPLVLAQQNQVSHGQSWWVPEDLGQLHTVPLPDRIKQALSGCKPGRQAGLGCSSWFLSQHISQVVWNQFFLFTIEKIGKNFTLCFAWV